MELLKKVYQHPLLSENELSLIIKAHNRVVLGKGDFVLKEKQIANEYFIVESGLLRSYVLDFDNKDITIDFFAQHEIVIEVSSLFQRIPTQENIQALTDCTCYKIDFDVFQELFHSIEGFSEWGRSWMSNSLFKIKQRSVAIITESATERYHKLMADKPQVVRYAPLKDIASYLGITDSSFSRIRKETVKSS